MNPMTGWEEDGMYRLAHDKAISRSYARCITQKQENELYEKNFQEELNRIIAKGERYEAMKAKGREERRLARIAKFKAQEEEEMIKAAFDAEISAKIDAELEVLLKIAESSQQTYVDPMRELDIIPEDDDFKIAN